MAAIYCINCENACSPQANACPKCGHPFTNSSNDAVNEGSPRGPQVMAYNRIAPLPSAVVQPTNDVQMVEQTSKKWKRIMLIGGLGVIFGSMMSLLDELLPAEIRQSSPTQACEQSATLKRWV